MTALEEVLENYTHVMNSSLADLFSLLRGIAKLLSGFIHEFASSIPVTVYFDIRRKVVFIIILVILITQSYFILSNTRLH